MYLAPLIMQATAPDAAAPNPIMQFLPFAAISNVSLARNVAFHKHLSAGQF